MNRETAPTLPEADRKRNEARAPLEDLRRNEDDDACRNAMALAEQAQGNLQDLVREADAGR